MNDAIKIPAQLATKGVEAGVIFVYSIFSPALVVITSLSEIFFKEKGMKKFIPAESKIILKGLYVII